LINNFSNDRFVHAHSVFLSCMFFKLFNGPCCLSPEPVHRQEKLAFVLSEKSSMLSALMN